MASEERPGGAEEPYDAYLESRRLADRRRAASVPRLLARAVALCANAAKGQLVALVALQLMAGLCAGGQVLLTNLALRRVLEAGPDDVLDLALVPVACLVLLSATGRATAVATAQSQRLLGERVSRAGWRRIIGVTSTVPLATYDDDRFYDHLHRVRTSADQQPVAVVTGVLSVVGGTATALAVLATLLALEPLLVPLLLLGALPGYLLQRRGGRLEYAFLVEQTPGLRRRFALLEVLTERAPAKEVRAFDLRDELSGRWSRLYDEHLSALRRLVRRTTFLQLAALAAGAALALVVLAVLLALVQRGRVPLSEASAAIAAVVLLAGAITSVSAGVGRLLRAALFLEDVESFYALEAGGAAAPAPREQALQFRRLTLDRVCFRYPGASVNALQDVELELRSGEVLALVGENGSGKTTLSKVLSGLYQPTSGRVLWDGTDARQLDEARLRSGTAVLFQDFIHYELSLRENIALGRPGPHPESDVHRAAESAGADEIATGLPSGWDTFLSARFPGGVDLSGGQWQRVALARAVLRDAPFVVLDEPTAALDPKAEARLFATLRRLFAGRTVVLVTHRFSSARLADRVAVLHQGRLVECGSHQELMARGDRYAKMFTLQAAAFADGGTARGKS